jgi:hypothetical protein
MNVPTRIGVAFAVFGILSGGVALLGLGMDDAFCNQTPRINPGIVAIGSLSAAGLAFVVGVLLLDIPDIAKNLLALSPGTLHSILKQAGLKK